MNDAPQAGGQRHLMHVFPSFGIGGAQSRLVELVKAYGQTYRHTIVALDGCTDMAMGMPAGAPVLYRRLESPMRGGWGKIADIRRFITSVNPDVLVTYNWGAIEWAFTNRLFSLARHIHIEDGFGPEERNRQFKRRIWFRRLALGGRGTIVVLPSRTLFNIAIGQWRLSKDRLRFITNGIDCARFAAVREAQDVGKPLVVGTVASLRREKNLARLIRAFADASKDRPGIPMQLLIVGDGRERGALQEAAGQTGLGEAIRFTGATDKPEVFFQKMDIFAMSSDTEQMPLVLLEAMASSLPVVSTDVGDIANLVAADNLPYVTKLDDVEGLRRSLVSFADSAPIRERLGRLNKQKAVEVFDYRQMAARYMELFG